jgi:predicted DCC family thiol-disulfide oxidoreductase YuxK
MYLKSLKTITSKLTIYYDGHCPLCLAEIHVLKHHNQKKLLHFVSLQEIDPNVDDINCELALKIIHARVGDGEIIVGPDVFFEAYKRSDLRIINYVFSFAFFRLVYAKFYLFFAKHRQRISRMIGHPMLTFVKKKYPDDMPSQG